MNSWRRSSVISPVRVRIATARSHSSRVSPTSCAKACRWRTSATISSPSRASGLPSKLATTRAVISSGVIGRLPFSMVVMFALPSREVKAAMMS